MTDRCFTGHNRREVKNMTKGEKILLMIILGIIIRFTPALDIVHELMHYGFCNAEGIAVLDLRWSGLTYARANAIVIYGGYGGEFLLYSALVVFMGNHKLLSAFFFGVLMVVIGVSYFSVDFNRYALDFYGDQSRVNTVKIIWACFTTPIFLILLSYKIKELKLV